jgi:hypothetical protein
MLRSVRLHAGQKQSLVPRRRRSDARRVQFARRPLHRRPRRKPRRVGTLRSLAARPGLAFNKERQPPLLCTFAKVICSQLWDVRTSSVTALQGHSQDVVG